VAEWWSAEFRALLCGWLPPWSLGIAYVDPAGPASYVVSAELLAARTQAVAANGVLFVLSVVAYQLPKGLGIATGARVGGCLGTGDAAGAKAALRQVFYKDPCSCCFLK